MPPEPEIPEPPRVKQATPSAHHRPVARPLAGSAPCDRVNQNKDDDDQGSGVENSDESAPNSGKYGIVHDPITGLAPWTECYHVVTCVLCFVPT